MKSKMLKIPVHVENAVLFNVKIISLKNNFVAQLEQQGITAESLHLTFQNGKATFLLGGKSLYQYRAVKPFHSPARKEQFITADLELYYKHGDVVNGPLGGLFKITKITRKAIYGIKLYPGLI